MNEQPLKDVYNGPNTWRKFDGLGVDQNFSVFNDEYETLRVTLEKIMRADTDSESVRDTNGEIRTAISNIHSFLEYASERELSPDEKNELAKQFERAEKAMVEYPL
jgi:acyl-CoA reductase-like NAD-dependent aldehyde dehydrogenase